MAAAAAAGGARPGPDSLPPFPVQRRPRHEGPVTLEKVLGVTARGSGALACDPARGLLAYPAGCVVVLLNPLENTQRHILNTSRKPLTALVFSPDGKLIVTGENGHQPAVRVWDVEDRAQVSALHGHKHGVSGVAFSPSSKYLVSVGYPHDMVVNVWDWKKASLVASKKVSCEVMAVSFAEDSYFVTVGHHHVKFWCLDSSKELKLSETVPLVGRSALLGELQGNVFCGVAGGRGPTSGSTFCVSSTGWLCHFNQNRVLEKRIPLKVPLAHCLCLGEELVFCGCANGTVRIFGARDLCYLCDLPKPHPLGVDVTQVPPLRRMDAVYPDAVALAYDPCHHWLCCVYKDHSIYIWDVGDLQNIRKVWSDLFHSSFIWSIEVYPEFEEWRSCLPPGSFLTCSSDNTIRAWTLESGSSEGNAYSTTLLKIIYVDNNTQHLQDSSSMSNQNKNLGHLDVKSGVRVMQVSPDGKHLASGDRGGTLRIHELQLMQEVAKVEAHDSEVLCLEYSKPETGATLLATASRDRLIHVLNVEKNYRLEQTLDDHCSAITAVKFAGSQDIQLISCGADKSIYFRNAQKLPDSFNFIRTHHVAEKTTLYDMDIDITQKYVAVACQDRNVRVYSTTSGKLKCCYKGSQADSGSLLKVQLDPSGTFLATSCSDKSITLINFHSGECMAKMFGHSEIVMGMRFTYDCRHLITVSGDSCIFIWRLGPEITSSMKQHLLELELPQPRRVQERGAAAQLSQETYGTVPSEVLNPDDARAPEEESGDEASSLQTPSREDLDLPLACVLTNGRLPMWAKRLLGEVGEEARTFPNPHGTYRPQGRWAETTQRSPIKILPEMDPSSFTPIKSQLEEEVELKPSSLEHLLSEVESSFSDITEDFQVACGRHEVQQVSELFLEKETSGRLGTPDPTGISLGELHVSEGCRQSLMELPLCPTSPEEFELSGEDASSTVLHHSGVPTPHHQPEADEDLVDFAGEVEEAEENPLQSNSQPQTPEQEKYLRQHFETLTDAEAPEKFQGSLKDLKPPELGEEEKNLFLNPRLSISARFLSRCQKNSRLAAAFPLQARPLLHRPFHSLELHEDQPKPPQELQQAENLLGEKTQETGDEAGSDCSKPKGSQSVAQTIAESLGQLRSRFQETLQLYDQVTLETTKEDATLLQTRTLFMDFLGWLQGELRSRAVTRRADAATSTEDAATPTDPQIMMLLRTYSESLLGMIQRRLESTSADTL